MTTLQKLTRLAAVGGLATTMALAGCKMHEEEQDQVLGFGRTPAEPAQQQMEDDMISSTVAFPTGQRASSALLVEKVMPRRVRVGEEFTYTVRVTNLMEQPMEQVVVYDQPDLSGMLAEGEQPQQQEGILGYAREPGAPPAQIGEAQQWNVGHLEPGETKLVRVQAVAREAGDLRTCTAVSYQPTLCMTTSVINPELRVERMAPEQILACDELEVRYRITNVGTGTAEDIMIREELPEGWSLAQRPGQQVQLALPALEEGATRDLAVRIDPADDAGEYTGRAIVETAFGETFQSEESVTRLVKPNLRVSVQAPEQVYAGEPATYRIQVSNTGDGVARDLRIREMLPAGVQVLETSGTPQQRAGQLVWQLPPLEPGQQTSVQVTLTAADPELIEGRITADAYCAQQVAGLVQTQFQGLTSILVELVDNNDPVQVGQTEVYDIVVTNQGSIPAQDLQVVATVPDEMEYLGTQGDVQPQVDGQQVTFTIPSLPAKESASMQIRARATQPGDVRFGIEVNSETLARPVSENEATRLY